MKVKCIKCGYAELEHEGLGVPLYICDHCEELTAFDLPTCQAENFGTDSCGLCRFRFPCWTRRHNQVPLEPEPVSSRKEARSLVNRIFDAVGL